MRVSSSWSGRVAWLLVGAVSCMAPWLPSLDACTMIALGKNATRDGSTIVSHTDDAGGDTGDLRLVRVPARAYAPGTKRAIYRLYGGYPRVVVENDRAHAYAPTADQNVSTPLGFIDQVAYTHGYLEQDYGIMNDVQLSIAESTCNGKTYGWSTDLPYGHNLFSIGELTRIALERCNNARCAVQTMGDLAVRHGFYGDYSGTPENPGHSSAEALGIADKYGEVWIFHILTGPGNGSAVWAAQRLVDDHVAVIPNEFIIEDLDLDDPDRYLASDNVHTFALEMGWWDPDTEPFSFKRVYGYSPEVTGPKLFLDGRVWRVFDRFAPSLRLEAPLGYVHEKPHFPFSVPVDKRVDVQDVMDMLRDHYEGTKYDLTQGVAAGPFGNPVRYSGYVPGVRGGWARAISLHRTLYSIVLQARGDLPDALGGITWYGQSAPHGTVYVPFSGAQRRVPSSYLAGKQSEFSIESAWWAFDFVNNWASLRYNAISVDIKAAIARLQHDALARQRRLHEELADWDDNFAIAGRLEADNNAFADHVVKEWWSLAWRLVSKYSDGYITTGEKEGEMQTPGYPATWLALTEFSTWPTVNQDSSSQAGVTTGTATVAAAASTASVASSSSFLSSIELGCGVLVGVVGTLLALHVHQTWRRRLTYTPIRSIV